MLARYREVRGKILLPSWVKPSPELLGSASHGTLTADEWNTTTLYAIPMTLIPLWGILDPSSREREMLDNFMHLVAVVRLLGKYTTSAELAAKVKEHYKVYCSGVVKLYPSHSLKPNHHLVDHTPDVLTWFGPSRIWSVWAFEFLNGLAQKIKTNWKFGE